MSPSICMTVDGFEGVQRGPYRKIIAAYALWKNGYDAYNFILSKEGREEFDDMVQEMKTIVVGRASSYQDLLSLYFQDMISADFIARRGDVHQLTPEMEDAAFYLAFKELETRGAISPLPPPRWAKRTSRNADPMP